MVGEQGDSYDGKKPSVEVEPNENISMDPAKVIINYLSFTSCIVCPGRDWQGVRTATLKALF